MGMDGKLEYECSGSLNYVREWVYCLCQGRFKGFNGF